MGVSFFVSKLYMKNIFIAFTDWLTNKITRQRLQDFLIENRSLKFGLNVGSGRVHQYQELFPNLIRIDLDSRAKVDVLADAHTLPFKRNSFEVVVCTEVLEHLHSPWLFVKELERTMKKNALLILTTRFMFPIHDGANDYYRYSKYGLKALFGHFKIMSIQEETINLETIAVLLQRLGFQSVTKPTWMRYVFFILAKIVAKLQFIVTGSYNNIERTGMDSVFCSGYFAIFKKNEIKN